MGKVSKKRTPRAVKKPHFETEDRERQDEAPVEGKMNPLDIPGILSIVVGYIDKVDDLKSVRQLNKSWREETFQKWRNSAVFLIYNETLPVLLAAFDERGLQGLSEERMAAVLQKRDTFRLKQIPFKKYRFTREPDWTYPLKEDELDKRLIWEKVISPNAAYLDVGECFLKLYDGIQCFSAIQWMFKQLPKVTDFAMAPFISHEECILEDSIEENVVDQWIAPSGDPVYVCEYPQVTSLTISTPDVERFGLQSVFKDPDDGISRITATYLFEMVPNLKNVELPEGGHYSIVQGMKRTIGKIPRVQLESITAFSETKPNLSTELLEYIKYTGPPIKDIRMTVFSKDIGSSIRSCWSLLQNTLTKLELDLKYPYRQKIVQIHGGDDLFYRIDPQYIRNYNPSENYPVNLTHLKITLDYDAYQWRLLRFYLIDLKEMRKLKEFHLGMKSSVQEDWATEKIEFKEVFETSGVEVSKKRKGKQGLAAEEENIFPDLKSFHFHGSLTKTAVLQLGRMAKKLQTLEIVFDEENIAGVNEINYPCLKNLKLLTCSTLPAQKISSLKASNPSWNIVDESKSHPVLVKRK